MPRQFQTSDRVTKSLTLHLLICTSISTTAQCRPPAIRKSSTGHLEIRLEQQGSREREREEHNLTSHLRDLNKEMVIAAVVRFDNWFSCSPDANTNFHVCKSCVTVVAPGSERETPDCT